MADIRGPNNAQQRSTPGGAFADRAWMAWVTRVLNNVYVGNSKGICGTESLRIADPSTAATTGSWRMWYTGGLLWVQPGRVHISDGVGGGTGAADAWYPWADSTPGDNPAYAVDPSAWSIAPATGTAVYWFYNWPTGRAFIDTTFGRGIALASGPTDWGQWYFRSDGWRSLYLGTIHSGSGGIYVTPAYPNAFSYAKGLQCRFRVQSARVIGWANNNGTGMGSVPDVFGRAWSPSAQLPLSSQGYLYYDEIGAVPGTGEISLSIADFNIGYYVTDSIGLLYLWETPLANLAPLP